MNIVEKLKKLFFGKKSAEGNSAERERADARSAAEDAEGLIPLLCPSFPFVVQWREESDLSPADSKFGGAPLLPPGFVWPVYAGEVVCPVYHADEIVNGEKRERPLSFLMQIDLSGLPPAARGFLPAKGYLSFFYDLQTGRWGGEAEDFGCARVYYFPDGDLSPVEPPAGTRLPERKICFSEAPDLPDWEEFVESDKTFGGDWEAYDRARALLGVDREKEEEAYNGKLLGYHQIIQDSMLQECEEMSRRSRGEDADDEEDVFVKSRDWTLLLQIGTVDFGIDEEELMWGDDGNLYFYIRRRDLAALNFGGAWAILQCF